MSTKGLTPTWEIGSSLFTYKRASSTEELDRLKSIICDNEIWLSSPVDFNDPFECNPDTIQFETNVVNWKAFANDMLKKVEPGWNRNQRRRWINSRTEKQIFKLMDFDSLKGEMVKKFNEVGIACFTKAPDNLLMWSHYTNGHRGVCLEFDQTKAPFDLAIPIEYTKEYKAFKVPPFDYDAIIKTLYLSKAECWSYEKEYRVALPDMHNRLYKYDKGALKSVTFGCNMPRDDITKIIQWLPKLSPIVKALCAAKKSTKYGLEFFPVGVKTSNGKELIWLELDSEKQL